MAHVCQHMNLRIVLRSSFGEPETAKQSTISNKKKRHNRKASPSSGTADHVVVNCAVTEYYTVVLERPMAGHVAVNYTKMALEDQAKVTEPQPEVQVVKRNEDETLEVDFL